MKVGRKSMPQMSYEFLMPTWAALRRVANKVSSPAIRREKKLDGRRLKSKASDEQVIEIRRLYDEGLPPRQISRLVGLDVPYVGKIARGETHRFVVAPLKKSRPI